MDPLFDVSPFVSAAVKEGRPVVALETTLVTHGLSVAGPAEIVSKGDGWWKQGEV
jgi:pseudouridine-5'-phosphate glycosidase